MIFGHSLKPKKKKKIEKKKQNEKIIKDKVVKDIRTLFEQQEEDYYVPKRISNFWNTNYIGYESNCDKIETYHLMNILRILNLTWGI